MEYQNMSFEREVPTEWPFQQFRNEILKMTLRATLHHSADQQVILTTNNVSALLTSNETGTRYIFRKIEELPDEFFQMHLIIPSEIMMLFNGETSLIPIEAENLGFHSRNLERRREITIAVPNFRRILEMRNIVGNQIYRSAFMSAYQNIGIME
ncbi:uncharacterized protein LOC133525241 [Cydia pomonella]|nr:uncharacterized protein LOC133525241 [Cydia pomonella]